MPVVHARSQQPSSAMTAFTQPVRQLAALQCVVGKSSVTDDDHDHGVFHGKLWTSALNAVPHLYMSTVLLTEKSAREDRMLHVKTVREVRVSR